MFGFGKKKKELVDDQRVYTVTNGNILPLSDVSDPVFSQGMMGTGYAIEPDDDAKIVSPVYAKVTIVQGHAIGLQRADGLQFLIHIGVDTVNLKGAPFHAEVAEDDIVEPGDELVKVDWGQIAESGLDKTVMVVMPNQQKLGATLKIDDAARTVKATQELGTAER